MRSAQKLRSGWTDPRVTMRTAMRELEEKNPQPMAI